MSGAAARTGDLKEKGYSKHSKIGSEECPKNGHIK